MDFVSASERSFMKLLHSAACFLLVLSHFQSAAQEPQTKNIIIVTLDGLRWQEVFQGPDPSILTSPAYVTSSEDIALFQQEHKEDRRKALMPFLWDVIFAQGQLYGNREFGNRVNCRNHHLLSYPGYSEMLVGFPYRKVSSNRKVENPHATVLEVIEKHPGFEDAVAAFATWDAFPFIFRESQSGIYINAGNDLAEGDISDRERRLNKVRRKALLRSDSLTFHYAMEYLKRGRPRVTFIGFDETDQHAHGARYLEYLKAAGNADRMLGELWKWVQSQPDYRNQTTLFITTDHGRGKGKNNWRKHRLLTAGSRHIWFAVVGPDTPAFGEMKTKTKMYQNQVAKTLAAFLGLPYKNEKPVGDVVQTMIAIPENPSAHAVE
jgi:hypothetical protein